MIPGVIKTSYNENERTIPVYPEQSKGLKKALLETIIFEVDSGIEYGYSNDHLKRLGCRLEDREILFMTCEILLLPKPTEIDFMQMPDGQVLWGWSHCVQKKNVTQYPIDKNLTIIPWEAMYV